MLPHWVVQQLPSTGIAISSFLAFWLAGNKWRVGWLLAILSEFGWVLYALWLKQYGLLISCIFFVILFYRNWIKWEPIPDGQERKS